MNNKIHKKNVWGHSIQHIERGLLFHDNLADQIWTKFLRILVLFHLIQAFPDINNAPYLNSRLCFQPVGVQLHYSMRSRCKISTFST